MAISVAVRVELLPVRADRRYPHVLRVVTLAMCLLIFCAQSAGAQTAGAVQRSYSYDYEAVWAATIGALQGRGDAIIYSDKPTGIVTTDYKVEDEEWRHKFNLLLVNNGNTTNVSVSSVVEKFSGSGAFSAEGWDADRSDGVREARLLDSIDRRLQPGGAAADLADTHCRSNFTVGGSMVRGSTYSTFVEFPGLSQASAIEALISAISSDSLTVLTTDKSTGTVSASGEFDNGKSYVLNFTLTSTAGSTRVKVVQKFGIGDRGNAAAVANEFCKIITGISVAMPRPAATVAISVPPTNKPATDLTIEERLRKLDELYKKGLITQDEYQKKRAELLSQL